MPAHGTGPLVILCAEYDALPGIGHGCGHNLIATASLAAFLGLAQTVRELEVDSPIRVRILGTPAEEGGGGKIKLIDAGAFKDPEIVAAIMAHPTSVHHLPAGYAGIAGYPMVASHKLRVQYRGRGAHAGGDPWNGRNALDAAVGAYNNIAMLRQQIQPDERIHGIIEVGGTAPNVIPEYTRMNWNVRIQFIPTLAMERAAANCRALSERLLDLSRKEGQMRRTSAPVQSMPTFGSPLRLRTAAPKALCSRRITASLQSNKRAAG